MVEQLRMSLDELRREEVLVQAWKKASTHIRYHNWFSDTLELDLTAVRLKDFLGNLTGILTANELVNSQPLRLVLAPKSQKWCVNNRGKWEPQDGLDISSKLRPLAHVSLQDQIISTGLMMILANRVETAQGDPRLSEEQPNRQRVISFGNRLFCDGNNFKLSHRWGSTKLYRGYFQDYQAFLERPENSAEKLARTGTKTVILQSDITQFFDRVSPELLRKSIRKFQRSPKEQPFFDFACNFLSWNWHESDWRRVNNYTEKSGFTEFSKVSLPQGLVSSGFFANTVLLSFDDQLRDLLGKDIIPGIKLVDAVRYVDDIRLVLAVEGHDDIASLEQELFEWLGVLLEDEAPGLELSRKKTIAAVVRGENRPIIKHSKKLKRIQSAISGGFDASGGSEVLGAILGLVGAQKRLESMEVNRKELDFLPVADVKLETVDRFTAARFRSTYRSLRPLLYWEDKLSEIADSTGRFSNSMSREELDEEAKAFAYELIAKWISDPSNVRLLRVGLDIWPDTEILERVLGFLLPASVDSNRSAEERSVAHYCLAEVLRAGAVETGFVDDPDKLPNDIDLSRYRETLLKAATKVLESGHKKYPWFVVQQAFLLTAVSLKGNARLAYRTRPKLPPMDENSHYRKLLRFLSRDFSEFSDDTFAEMSVLTRRSFRSMKQTASIIFDDLNARRANLIAKLDPDFGSEMAEIIPSISSLFYGNTKSSLGYKKSKEHKNEVQLSEYVLSRETKEVLRNEYSLLQFTQAFLKEFNEKGSFDHISPADVYVTFENTRSLRAVISSVRIARSGKSKDSLYSPPSWCLEEERWRFQLGYILRFILSGRRDFTKPARATHWKEFTEIYRPATSHWYQRFYGLYSGHSAFGDDWLPISDWTENLLFRLLRWPGCPSHFSEENIEQSVIELLHVIQERILFLRKFHGRSVDMLPVNLPRGYSGDASQPIRACIVQTVIPGEKGDFDLSDLTMSGKEIRIRHRRHLSAALSAVTKALELRETHKEKDGRLDLLVLPELAVHPSDISTHVIPFMRKHRTTVLTGVTYEEIEKGEPLVNSALWLLPMQDTSGGFRVKILRQGKGNLAPDEEANFNKTSKLIRPFRPCQWLVGYQWTSDPGHEPLWLTASVCFDATDINLAADLRDHSDVYLVSALNKDVGTFDQMAQALHYHMFQMVVVANNGLYGGSNAYAPYSRPYKRQVFHMHGQPQASIAFLEIDQISDFKARRHPPKATNGDEDQKSTGGLSTKFKQPPAASILPEKNWLPE